MKSTSLYQRIILGLWMTLFQIKVADSIDDLVFSYQSKNISFLALQKSLNVSVFWSPSTCSFQMRQQFSCANQCQEAVSQRGSSAKPCYCDTICMELGDCCYDYVTLCSPGSQWAVHKTPQRACVDLNKDSKAYVLVNRCPAKHSNTKMVAKCNSTNRLDMVSRIPVYDMRTNVSFRNAYCASCHGVSNWTYWSLSMGCIDASSINENSSTEEVMDFVREHCKWTYLPKSAQGNFNAKPCIHRDEKCPLDLSRSSNSLTEITRHLCALYSLPYKGEGTERRNPHCALCRHEESRACPRRRPIPPPVDPGPPSLTILFNIQSAKSYKISIFGKGVDRQTTGQIQCNDTQVFNPFTLKCNNLPQEVQKKLTEQNRTRNYFLGDNCTLATFNISQVFFEANDSISLLYKGLKYYFSNGTFILEDYTVYLCLPTVAPPPQDRDSTSISALQIITYIGSGLSILAEVALLALYLLLKDLRNVPGMILMSLVFCLLVYQVFFLMTGLTNIRGFCVAVAVIVHYFLLAAFAWMSCMAHMVMNTFGRKTVRQVTNSLSTFMKYCFAAYGIPVLIVATALILDRTNSVEFGYGEGPYCWILGAVPLIATLHVPVAMVILFNIFALTWTIKGIRRTMKTSSVARSSRGTTGASYQLKLCIKLSTVMGFTWIFGLLVGFISCPYLEYPYVILNSLQGFFIFIAFTTNKRVIGLLRARFQQRRWHSTSTAETGTKQTRL